MYLINFQIYINKKLLVNNSIYSLSRLIIYPLLDYITTAYGKFEYAKKISQATEHRDVFIILNLSWLEFFK